MDGASLAGAIASRIHRWIDVAFGWISCGADRLWQTPMEQAVKRPPINFNGLDTAVHGPIRLGVLTALQVDGPLDFMTLRSRLDAGDGSLGLHLGRLEDAGYIDCQKSFVA